MIDIHNLTIRKAHNAMKRKEFSALDLVKQYHAVIAEKNPSIHALLEVFEDGEAQALRADTEFAGGTATLLTGIPIVTKDNICLLYTSDAADE